MFDESTTKEIKDILTIAKPVIDPLISAFISPKIEKLKAWLKTKEIDNKIIDNVYEDKFAEYLSRTYLKCQEINILIFPGLQINIKEIYQPLTLIANLKSKTDDGHFNFSPIRNKIDNFEEYFIKPYGKILISDTAGMGKSTLSKWICMKVIENRLAIPVLIELRNLRENYSILDEIHAQINQIDKVFDKDLIIKFLELGQFLIILDGFDELPNEKSDHIIKSIKDFIDKTSPNWFILTSRPEGSLTAFGDFQTFHIRPLRLEEAFALIRKYDVVSPNKVGESLITNINNKLSQVQELLINPFLVSLLYSVYAFNHDIPDDKVTFYDDIYSALYKKHDLSKNGWTRPKKSKLSILQFKKLLRQLAFDSARKSKVSYTESEILDFIEKAKAKIPDITTNADDFLDDLLKAVPLFQRDGHKIKWGHKSLQDFFASDFITYSAKKEEILKWILNSNNFGLLNILDFFVEQDFPTYRKVILYGLLKDFVKHYEHTYKYITGVSKKDIHLRKLLTFNLHFLFYKADSEISDSRLYDYANHNLIKNTPAEFQHTYPDVDDGAAILTITPFQARVLYDLIAKVPNLSYIQINPFKGQFSDTNIELREDAIYELDDYPENHLNSPVNFSKATNHIASLHSLNGYFKYPEAKIEMQLIANEIEIENKANESFDF